MIPLSQYIEQRIDVLNQLDHEMARRHELRNSDSHDPQTRQAAVDQLRQARDAADQRLFDLFAIRSAKLATPQVTAHADAAWMRLLAAWQNVVGLLDQPLSPETQRISDLLDESATT